MIQNSNCILPILGLFKVFFYKHLTAYIYISIINFANFIRQLVLGAKKKERKFIKTLAGFAVMGARFWFLFPSDLNPGFRMNVAVYASKESALGGYILAPIGDVIRADWLFFRRPVYQVRKMIKLVVEYSLML